MFINKLILIILGLLLISGPSAAKDKIRNLTLSETQVTQLSKDKQKEAILLRDDLTARQNIINQTSKETQTPMAAYPPTACDPFPLPTDPIGPYTKIESEQFGDQFYWTAWKYPCNEEFSWVVFTIEPKTSLDRPFICSSQITIIQDGLEESSLKLCVDPYDESCASKCGDVIAKTSYALTKYSYVTSDKIDLNKSFYLDWDLSSSIIQGDIPEYDPSEYGYGQPSIQNQLAVNGLFYDPNKGGHGFDVNQTEFGLMIYYYGHTKDGERLWLISDLFTGSVEYNVPVALGLFEVKNGVFGDPVKSETRWGDMTFTLTDCDHGVASLTGIDGSFSVNVVRLAGLNGMDCNQSPGGLE